MLTTVCRNSPPNKSDKSLIFRNNHDLSVSKNAPLPIYRPKYGYFMIFNDGWELDASGRFAPK
jgi:hypothetical protein